MYGHQKNSSSADSAGFSQRRRQWNYRGTYHRIWCMVHLKLVKQLLFADVIKSKIGWLTLRGSVIFYVTALMSDADRLVVFMQFDIWQITDYNGIYSLLYRSGQFVVAWSFIMRRMLRFTREDIMLWKKIRNQSVCTFDGRLFVNRKNEKTVERYCIQPLLYLILKNFLFQREHQV